MNRLVLTTAVLLTVATGRAFADSDGDPFPFKAAPQQTHGPAFAVETGSEPYPASTGSTAQPSSLAKLEPASDRESAVQTASSLPRGFNDNTVMANHAPAARRTLEAGFAGPAG